MPPVPRSLKPSDPSPRLAEVRHLPLTRTDPELVDGLRAGHGWATAMAFDRYGPDVQRVLAWILGPDVELPDLLHDVFVKAFEGISDLSYPERLRQWLLAIAVYTARERIRKRTRDRWFRLFTRREPCDAVSDTIGPEHRQLVAATRAVLARLSPDERIAFSLRLMGGLGLEEVAEACGVSLATIKRRIASARSRFESLARQDPVLREWLQEAGSCNDG